jgi:hypothetical protein
MEVVRVFMIERVLKGMKKHREKATGKWKLGEGD